jgi:hypothetical protein
MTEFLINLPYHKRWWLPDGRHQYNSVLYGDWFHITIIDSWTDDIRQGHDIQIKPGHEDLLLLSQELARKRYPRQLRHKSRDRGHLNAQR